MEKKDVEVAATLQKKKITVSKGKVKKTIKNVLCRPDPVLWPNLLKEQSDILKTALSAYKVEIREFKKLHWKVLKDIPKDQRPKQPEIKKVEGLVFGIRECTELLKNKQCSAVIIESAINPRALVQPVMEAGNSNNIPVLCINDLRKHTSHNFGIPTSCLAIKTGFLQELQSKIEDIAKMHKEFQLLVKKKMDIEADQKLDNVEEKMELSENENRETSKTISDFKYLYRTSKRTRIFNPSSETPNVKKAFIGQDFIELSSKSEQNKPVEEAYKSMKLKRVTNNQNREKKK